MENWYEQDETRVAAHGRAADDWGFLSSLGQSLMTASVPQISRAYNISEATGEWLTMGYILILGIVSAFTAFHNPNSY